MSNRHFRTPRVRRVGPLVVRVAAIVMGLASAIGCNAASASPTAPASVSEFIVPDVLVASVALIDADARPIPILNQPGGHWMRGEVRGVVLDANMPAGVRAQCCGSDRLIHWSTAWLPDPSSPHDVRVAAAILMHETRHAQGYRHTCPDQRRDRTFDEGGAWAVHSAWLRHMGDSETADSIATFDIGCG